MKFSTNAEALEYLVNKSRFLGVQEISCTILDDNRFTIWSGSACPEHHHYGYHGLLHHTAEVVSLCLSNNTVHDMQLSEDKIYLAALFHDYGKIWDYKIYEDGSWGPTDHKKKIHHIHRSALEFYIASKPHIDEIIIDEIVHAILAHHDKYGGTSVTPQTKLAWLLHLCDGISGRTYENRQFYYNT